MTPYDIRKLAEAAGLKPQIEWIGGRVQEWYPPDDVARMVAVAVAREREACAEVCEDERTPYSDVEWTIRCDLAAAIRARAVEKMHGQ